MKFLEKLFGGKHKINGPERLTLDELVCALEAENIRVEEAACTEAKPVLKDIYASFERICSLAAEVEKKDCPKDVNARLRTVIRTAKPEFAREVFEAVKSAGEGKQSRFSEKKKEICKTMDLLAKALMGPGKYLHAAYGEEIEAIRKELKNLAQKKKILDEIDCSNADIEDTLKEAAQIGDIMKHESALKKQIEEAEARLKSLEDKEKSLSQQISEIESGSQYGELQKKKKELQRMESDREEKENTLYNLITPLRRPVRMFIKSSWKNATAYSSMKELEKYVEDPVDSILCGDPKKLASLLSDLQRNLDEDRDIKDEDRKKISQRIKTVREHDLEAATSEIVALRSRIMDLASQISSSEVEGRMSNMEKERAMLQREIRSATEDISKVVKKIGKDRKDLEEKRFRLEQRAAIILKKKVSLALS